MKSLLCLKQMIDIKIQLVFCLIDFIILNPAKLETHDAPKYVPYVTLPEETFAKMTQISN